MPDLLKYVDTPALLKAITEMGSVLPAGVEVDLERHLQVFARRYMPPKEAKWAHKTLKTVPNTVRRFFGKPRYEKGSFFFRYDEKFLCGWRKGLMQTPKSLATGASEEMIRRVELAEQAIQTSQCAKHLNVASLIRIIPKTKNMRRGSYNYIEIPFHKDSGKPTYSPYIHRKAFHGYLSGYYGRDHLHIFKESPESLVKATSIASPDTPDTLLLYNDKFFLVGLG